MLPISLVFYLIQEFVLARTVAPDFARRLISEEVAEGDQLKWTVQVTGDPIPAVTWMRNGLVIPHCDEVRLIDVSCSFFFFSFLQ